MMKIALQQGRGCGTVGRAVASGTRNLRFESRHPHKKTSNVIICQLQSRKDENNGKEAGNGLIKRDCFADFSETFPADPEIKADQIQVDILHTFNTQDAKSKERNP